MNAVYILDLIRELENIAIILHYIRKKGVCKQIGFI